MPVRAGTGFGLVQGFVDSEIVGDVQDITTGAAQDTTVTLGELPNVFLVEAWISTATGSVQLLVTKSSLEASENVVVTMRGGETMTLSTTSDGTLQATATVAAKLQFRFLVGALRVPPGPQDFGGFSYLAHAALTTPDPVTSSVSVPKSGNKPAIFTLLDAHEFVGGITAGRDFFTEWEGFLTFQATQRNAAAIIMRTKHAVGENFAKEFSHERVYFTDTGQTSVPITVPLNVFNSISRVMVGTFAGVEITDEDLALPSKITYEVEIQFFTRTSTTDRKTANITALRFDHPGTVSYQIGKAGSGGGGGGGGAGTVVTDSTLDGDGSATNPLMVANPFTDADETKLDGLKEPFTSALKTKLDGIAANAEVNVQSDWNQATDTADDYIENKPFVPTIYTETSNPTDATGVDGDFWFNVLSNEEARCWEKIGGTWLRIFDADKNPKADRLVVYLNATAAQSRFDQVLTDRSFRRDNLLDDAVPILAAWRVNSVGTLIIPSADAFDPRGVDLSSSTGRFIECSASAQASASDVDSLGDWFYSAGEDAAGLMVFNAINAAEARASAGGLTDAVIGEKAFKNPPGINALNDTQKLKVRQASKSAEALTDAEIGDKAFSNPPTNLDDTEKAAVRTAIGAGTGSGGGDADLSDYQTDRFVLFLSPASPGTAAAVFAAIMASGFRWISTAGGGPKPAVPILAGWLNGDVATFVFDPLEDFTPANIFTTAFANATGGTLETTAEDSPADVDAAQEWYYASKEASAGDITYEAMNAVAAASSGGGGGLTTVSTDTTLTGDGTSGDPLKVATPTPSDAQIGDKAFSNPPTDLDADEKTAVRTAIGAGTGGSSGTSLTVVPQSMTQSGRIAPSGQTIGAGAVWSLDITAIGAEASWITRHTDNKKIVVKKKGVYRLWGSITSEQSNRTGPSLSVVGGTILGYSNPYQRDAANSEFVADRSVDFLVAADDTVVTILAANRRTSPSDTANNAKTQPMDLMDVTNLRIMPIGGGAVLSGSAAPATGLPPTDGRIGDVLTASPDDTVTWQPVYDQAAHDAILEQAEELQETVRFYDELPDHSEHELPIGTVAVVGDSHYRLVGVTDPFSARGVIGSIADGDVPDTRGYGISEQDNIHFGRWTIEGAVIAFAQYGSGELLLYLDQEAFREANGGVAPEIGDDLTVRVEIGDDSADYEVPYHSAAVEDGDRYYYEYETDRISERTIMDDRAGETMTITVMKDGSPILLAGSGELVWEEFHDAWAVPRIDENQQRIGAAEARIASDEVHIGQLEAEVAVLQQRDTATLAYSAPYVSTSVALQTDVWKPLLRPGTAIVNEGGWRVGSAGLTIPQDGVYHVDTSLLIGNIEQHVTVEARFAINRDGADIEFADTQACYLRNASGNQGVEHSALLPLRANDQLFVQLRGHVATTVMVEGAASSLGIYRVGPIRAPVHGTEVFTGWIQRGPSISAANVDLSHAENTHGQAHGDWVLRGIPDGEWLLWWAVPTDFAQPGLFTIGGLDVTTAIGAPVQRTIGAVDYNIYLAVDSAYADPSWDGETITLEAA